MINSMPGKVALSMDELQEGDEFRFVSDMMKEREQTTFYTVTNKHTTSITCYPNFSPETVTHFLDTDDVWSDMIYIESEQIIGSIEDAARGDASRAKQLEREIKEYAEQESKYRERATKLNTLAAGLRREIVRLSHELKTLKEEE